MKKQLCILLAIVACVLIFSENAPALLVDFEGLGLSEGTLLDNQLKTTYGIDLGNTAILGKVGSDPMISGWGTSDSPRQWDAADAPFDSGYFITDLIPSGGDFGTDSDAIECTFSVPVFDVSFYIGDLNGPSDSYEYMAAKVYDVSNNLLETITANGGQSGFGDRSSVQISFTSSNIHRLEIDVYRGGNTRTGWGIDNLSFQSIPEPATILLIGVGFLGFACLRRKPML